MKLISLNIELNRHHDLVLPFLKKENPDIICLQELLEEDFDMYKKELGMEGVIRITSYVNDSIHLESLGKKYGIGIFSNSIVDSGYSFYVSDLHNIEIPYEDYVSDKNLVECRALLWADIKDGSDNIFKIVTSHMPITHHGEVTTFQIESNDKFIKQAKELGDFVFCGDTNAPRGREAFDRISKEFKDNIPLSCKTSLDSKIHKSGGVDFMVDCLFTTSKYIASNVELKGGISDHMAVISDINKI